MESYRDNLEIDLKDLTLRIIKNWKAILIAAALCAIVGVGFAFAAGGYIPSIDKEPQKITLNEFKDMIKSKLTSKEIRDVELAYNAYVECEKLYAEIEKSDSENNVENEIELLKATQQLISIKTNLTTDQQLYFNTLFEGKDGKISAAFISRVNNDFTLEDKGNATESKKNFSMKYIILAAILGAIIVIIISALKYITAPVLKTSEDLRSAFKLPIISSLRTGNDTDFNYVYSSIHAATKSSDAKKIFFIGAAFDSTTNEVKHKICEMFKENETSVAIGNILDNPESLDSVVDSDGVILFEKVYLSKYKDIAREVELCNSLGINIIGAVMIK